MRTTTTTTTTTRPKSSSRRKWRPPPVFLCYQRKVCRDRSEVRIIEKSRRIGLSWALAGDAVLEAARSRGCDQFYVGYNKEMAEQFIKDCGLFVEGFHIIATQAEEAFFDDVDDDGKLLRRILMFVIRFSSGHRIHALSSRPENLRSKQGHLIVDEAAFHRDLPSLIKAGMAFTMWGRGGRVTVVSTHNGVDNPFAMLIEETRAGKHPFSLHRITLKQALRDGLFRRMCLVNGVPWTKEGERAWEAKIRAQYGEDGPEELDCVPCRSGGTYLPRGLLEECTADVPLVRVRLKDEFAQRPDEYRAAWAKQWCEQTLAPLLRQLSHQRAHSFGQDFGRVSDLSVLAPMEIGQDLRRRVPFLVELRNVPYMEQAYIAQYVLDRLPMWRRALFDATGNGAFLGERMVQKFCAVPSSASKTKDDDTPPRVEKLTLSEKWYGEHMPKVKDGFERGLIVIPRDADVVQDFQAFRVIDGIPKLPKHKQKQIDTDKGGPKVTRHGDAGVAISLAYIASLGPAAAYGYKSVKELRRDKGRRPVATTAGFKATRGGIL